MGNLNNPSLYNQDYALWLTKTVEQVRLGQWENLDIENLIEELESMGKSEKRALNSLLTRLFEHLLKLTYWEAERDYNQRGWKGEVRNFRLEIKAILEDSPSRCRDLEENFHKCYRNARKITIDATGLPPDTFPTEPLTTLEQVLDEDWLPKM